MQQWNFTMCKHPTAYACTFPNGSTLSLAVAREPGRIGWVTGRTYTMGATTVYSWQASHDALGRPISTADSESAARSWTYNERSEMTGCTSSDGSYSYFYNNVRGQSPAVSLCLRSSCRHESIAAITVFTLKLYISMTPTELPFLYFIRTERERNEHRAHISTIASLCKARRPTKGPWNVNLSG